MDLFSISMNFKCNDHFTRNTFRSKKQITLYQLESSPIHTKTVLRRFFGLNSFYTMIYYVVLTVIFYIFWWNDSKIWIAISLYDLRKLLLEKSFTSNSISVKISFGRQNFWGFRIRICLIHMNKGWIKGGITTLQIWLHQKWKFITNR